MLEVKVKLDKGAKMPKRSKKGDAGFDLTARSLDWCLGKPYMEYGTGVSLEIPEGYVGKVYSRSSISKKGATLANGVGIIDSGYRGEIKCRFYPDPYISKPPYANGDRIAQLIIEKLPEVELIGVEELETSERGEGGFGSTGN